MGQLPDYLRGEMHQNVFQTKSSRIIIQPVSGRRGPLTNSSGGNGSSAQEQDDLPVTAPTSAGLESGE